MRVILFLHTLVTLTVTVASAFSFSFSDVTPRSCETVVVEWRGGQAPFSLTLMPVYDYPLNVSLPASAWNEANKTGRYEWKVNYPSGKRLSAIMSDATGLATGGVSPIVTVGAAAQGESCDLRSEATDFYFYLNQTSVTQCSPVEIYWDKSAIRPVTFIGAIPGGQAFQVNGGSGNRLDWTVNIPSGTQFLIAAFDAGTHGIGGSSDLMTVGPADDTSCLDALSPSSTIAGQPSSTGAGAPVRTVTQTGSADTSVKGGHNLSGGAIAGIVIGAIVGLVALQFILFWFCCRKPLAAYRQQKHETQALDRRRKSSGNVDLISTDGSFQEDRAARAAYGNAHANSSRASRLMDLDMTEDDFGAEDRLVGNVTDYSQAGAEGRHSRRDWTNYEPSPFPLTPLSLASSPDITQAPPSLPSPIPSSPITAGHSRRQSVQSQSRYSKAQLALQNPDDEARPLPPAGFRRHEDAGRLQTSSGEEQLDEPAVDLPPLYSAQWAATQGMERRES